MRQTVLVMALAVGCGISDQAERDYQAYLSGAKTGAPRGMSLARLDKAIAAAPDRVRYLEARASFRADGREFNFAVEDLDAAIQLDSRPYLRFVRAMTLCQSGRPDAALADFDVAIAADAKNWQFYRGRSLARSAVGQAQEALADAAILIERMPKAGESYYVRGVALEKMGRVMEAIADYTEAIRLRPELVYPLTARAAAFARTGDSMRSSADIAAAEKKLLVAGACGPCLDPFRY